MGTSLTTRTYKPCSESQLVKQIKEMQDQDREQYGYDSYNSSSHHCQISAGKEKLAKLDNATMDRLMDDIDKYNIHYYQYGQFDPKAFEVQNNKALNGLFSKALESAAKLQAHEQEIYLRLMKSKSSSRGCKACDCSFSIKTLTDRYKRSHPFIANQKTKTLQDRVSTTSSGYSSWGATRRTTESDEQAFNRQESEMGSMLEGLRVKMSLPIYLLCPICSSTSFLVTQTDQKSHESKTARFKADYEAYRQAKEAHAKKLLGKLATNCGWLVVIAAPS